MCPNRTGGAEALSDDAGLYDHPARTITVQSSLCGAPGGHSAAAAARAGMPGWSSRRPAPADMACELRLGEHLRDEQLWGPIPALETAELGVELVVLEHSAGEAQPIRGLQPKDGTVPSPTALPQTHVQTSKIQRSRALRGTVLYLAIRSAHVILLPALSSITPGAWKRH
jgi:hypothetical protein